MRLFLAATLFGSLVIGLVGCTPSVNTTPGTATPVKDAPQKAETPPMPPPPPK